MSCINIFEGPIIVQQMYIHKVDDVHLYSLNELLEIGNLTLILQRVPFNSFFKEIHVKVYISLFNTSPWKDVSL